MDITKMLAELRAERVQVEEAILVLERIARGRGKRRGRPPAWMKMVKRRGATCYRAIDSAGTTIDSCFRHCATQRPPNGCFARR